MTTSGSTNFTQTAREAITTALELVTMAIGQTPDPISAENARTHANLMLKTWGTVPRLWINTEGTPITLIAGTVSYSLTTARRVTSVRRRTGTLTAQQDIPVRLISRQEYYDKPNKLSTGTPLEAYFDPQRTTRTLTIWPAPDATVASTVTLPYTYARVIEDLDALDNDIDIPQEWLEAFDYNLAARLLIPYRKYVTDPASAAKIEQHAQTLYAQLSGNDDEDAPVFMQPAFS